MYRFVLRFLTAVYLLISHAGGLPSLPKSELNRLRDELRNSERLLGDVEKTLLASNVAHADVKGALSENFVNVDNTFDVDGGDHAASSLLTLNANQNSGSNSAVLRAIRPQQENGSTGHVLLDERARIAIAWQELNEKRQGANATMQNPQMQEALPHTTHWASLLGSSDRISGDGDGGGEKEDDQLPYQQLIGFFTNPTTLIVAGCVFLCIGFSHCAGFDTMTFSCISFIVPYADYVPWQGKLLLYTFTLIGLGGFAAMVYYPFTRAILVVASVPCFFMFICLGCASIILHTAWNVVGEGFTESFDKMSEVYDKLDDLLDFLGIGTPSSDDDTVCCAAKFLSRGKAKEKAKPKKKLKTSSQRKSNMAAGQAGLLSNNLVT